MSLLSAVLLLWSCASDELLPSPEGDPVSVTFRPVLEDVSPATRAIGAAEKIDNIVVGVYETTGNSLSHRFSCEKAWADVERNGLSLSLIEGRSYKVVFWAECGSNTAYTLTEAGTIEADYRAYLNGGFGRMEELDAFYAVSDVSVGSSPEEDKGTINLSRPLAQLNFADNATNPEQDAHKAVLTITDLPISFDLFGGTVETSKTAAVFTFEDFPEDKLNVGGSEYHYVASSYLLAPSSGTFSVGATLDFQQKSDGSTIRKVELTGDDRVTLERNRKTNVLGSIVRQPEVWSVWDGVIPAESPLSTDSENRYIIDEASDLAWLSANGAALDAGSTFLQTMDIDMAAKTIGSVRLPAGSTYDGGGHTVRSYANSLFGDATNLTVNDLIVEGSTVTAAGTVTHVGTLVNTLTGSSSFRNVTVTGSSVSTSNGAAGGLVGYIRNKDGETLGVTFSGCTAAGNTVGGSLASGVYVGRFRGYDNSETLTFLPDNNASSAAFPATAAQPYYVTDNVATWLSSEDYSSYSGWVGDEEYNRGIVTCGTERYIPCWDGTKKVTPLTDGTTKLIYSAFDLAALQGGSHTAVTFKGDVDLGGDRATDKNRFTPISSIGTLDGENHKLYNLNIFHDSWIVGFINGTSGASTTHKNLHFVNSSVRAKMDGDEAQVYVGTLCPNVNTKYTVDNITITGGYVLGLGKVGGLIGFVTSEDAASLDCSNCKVESSTIENIEGTHDDVFGTDEINVTFKPHGEAGGLIGFIANDANITACQVNNCKINCYGQDDKKVMYIYTVPGRHVNRFIGDIRTLNGDAIVIKDCSATGNTFGQRREDRHSYKSGRSDVYCDLVGRAYSIIGDTKGSVKIVKGSTSTTIF